VLLPCPWLFCTPTPLILLAATFSFPVFSFTTSTASGSSSSSEQQAQGAQLLPSATMAPSSLVLTPCRRAAGAPFLPPWSPRQAARSLISSPWCSDLYPMSGFPSPWSWPDLCPLLAMAPELPTSPSSLPSPWPPPSAPAIFHRSRAPSTCSRRPLLFPVRDQGASAGVKLHLRTAANTLSMGANSLDAEPLLPPLADALHSAPLRSVSSRGVQVPCAQLFSPWAAAPTSPRGSLLCAAQ
jgi:hypothetical protein